MHGGTKHKTIKIKRLKRYKSSNVYPSQMYNRFLKSELPKLPLFIGTYWYDRDSSQS